MARKKAREVPSPAPYEWQEAFDQLDEPIFIHDQQLRILRCNAAYAACAGEPMEAIVGKPYWQVFPKMQDGAPAEEETEFTTEAGQVFLTREVTVHKASGEFWYSRHQMENITARRVQEEMGKLRTSFSDAIIGSAPGVFIVVDQNSRLVRWNSGLNALTGRSDAALQETSLLSLLPEGERERIATKLKEAFTAGYAQGEMLLQKPCQGAGDHVFSARCFEMAGASYLAIFCIDKTEVRQLASDLVREKLLSDTIIESAPGAFFLIDQQGNLVRWNRYLSEETGLSDEQLRGSSILAAIHEPDRPLAAAKFLSAFALGYAEMEVRVPTANRGIRLFFKTARRFVIDGVPYVAGFCVDVTDRRQAEAALAKEKAFSDALIESVPGAFYVVDREGNYCRWNSYLNRLTGLSDQELKQRISLLTIHEQDRSLAAAMMKEAFDSGYAKAELRVPTHERGVRLYCMATRRFQVANAHYLVGVGVDTTERIAKERELEREARTDPLTQVANRGYFLEMARQEFARCDRYGHPLSLLMIDIDHFKVVNDTHGHHAGDVALQALVRTSRQALRDWDIMGRLGGEEFAVLLPETDADQALLVAERLRQTVAATSIAFDPENSVCITVSAGVVTVCEDDTEVDSLLDRADRALYAAKRGGRNKVCVAEGVPAI